jgi:hypothetical protein
MKTTVRLPDALLQEARRLARRDQTTLRALIEEGLQLVIAERSRTGAYRLRRATFKGAGLQAGVADASWEQIRDLAYDGRGA